MTCVAGIFARGGSKGLPNKNIKVFHGKPLIAWSIQCALSISRIDRVLVSTDSPEIAEIALKYGAEVPFLRPESLSTDDSPELLSWQHFLNYIKVDQMSLPDVFVSLPVTSPLREPSDVEKCLDVFKSGKHDAVITVADASRNPFFNMVKETSPTTVKLFAELPKAVYRRQDAPKVYDVTTVAYIADPNFVLNNISLFDGNLGFVNIPRERSIDIDTQLDFKIAEMLFTYLKSNDKY